MVRVLVEQRSKVGGRDWSVWKRVELDSGRIDAKVFVEKILNWEDMWEKHEAKLIQVLRD